MKIIKEGVINKKVLCAFCGCVYEFDVSDIKEDYSYGGLTTTLNEGNKRYVECPCCKNKHYVNNICSRQVLTTTIASN